MIYTFLIAALLLRPHKASFIFVACATLFNILFGNLDGSIYFFAAALCDFVVTGLLFNLRISRKVLDVMLVSIVSLGLNLVGWILWYLYQPPDIYTGLFGILYTTAIVVILKKDGTDVGGTTLHIDYSVHHTNVASVCRMVSQGKKGTV